MIKEPKQKSEHLENKKSFRGEIKSIFPNFKELPVAKNCLRPESAPLKTLTVKRLIQETFMNF